MTDKNNFYFQGKFFEDEEAFWQYVQKWGGMPLDQETADRLLNQLKKDILLNIFMFEREYTNNEFQKLLGKVFEDTLFEMGRKK